GRGGGDGGGWWGRRDGFGENTWPAGAEGRVEGAVGVEACHRELVFRFTPATASHQDAALVVQCRGLGRGYQFAWGENRGGLATDAEGGVEAARRGHGSALQRLQPTA